MKDKLKLQFSKRNDFNEKTKIEIFNLIDSYDSKFLENAYNDYIKLLKEKKK